MIPLFTSGPVELVNKLNDMVRIINQLDSMTGDGIVRVNQTSAGRALSLNVDGLLQRLPKEAGGGSDIHLAYCTADAPSGSIIDCYLDTDLTGEEIEVKCNISGGTALNASSRRLELGDAMLVVLIKSVYYAIEGFQATEDCVCSE